MPDRKQASMVSLDSWYKPNSLIFTADNRFMRCFLEDPQKKFCYSAMQPVNLS